MSSSRSAAAGKHAKSASLLSEQLAQVEQPVTGSNAQPRSNRRASLQEIVEQQHAPVQTANRQGNSAEDEVDLVDNSLDERVAHMLAGHTTPPSQAPSTPRTAGPGTSVSLSSHILRQLTNPSAIAQEQVLLSAADDGLGATPPRGDQRSERAQTLAEKPSRPPHSRDSSNRTQRSRTHDEQRRPASPAPKPRSVWGRFKAWITGDDSTEHKAADHPGTYAEVPSSKIKGLSLADSKKRKPKRVDPRADPRQDSRATTVTSTSKWRTVTATDLLDSSDSASYTDEDDAHSLAQSGSGDSTRVFDTLTSPKLFAIHGAAWTGREGHPHEGPSAPTSEPGSRRSSSRSSQGLSAMHSYFANHAPPKLQEEKERRKKSSRQASVDLHRSEPKRIAKPVSKEPTDTRPRYRDKRTGAYTVTRLRRALRSTQLEKHQRIRRRLFAEVPNEDSDTSDEDKLYRTRLHDMMIHKSLPVAALLEQGAQVAPSPWWRLDQQRVDELRDSLLQMNEQKEQDAASARPSLVHSTSAMSFSANRSPLRLKRSRTLGLIHHASPRKVGSLDDTVIDVSRSPSRTPSRTRRNTLEEEALSSSLGSSPHTPPHLSPRPKRADMIGANAVPPPMFIPVQPQTAVQDPNPNTAAATDTHTRLRLTPTLQGEGREAPGSPAGEVFKQVVMKPQLSPQTKAALWKNVKKVDKLYFRKLRHRQRQTIPAQPSASALPPPHQAGLPQSQSSEDLRARRTLSQGEQKGPSHPDRSKRQSATVVRKPRGGRRVVKQRRVAWTGTGYKFGAFESLLPSHIGRGRVKKGFARKYAPSHSEKFWIEVVIPQWNIVCNTPVVRKLWDRDGVPPALRGIVWSLAIGNSADVSPDTYFATLPESFKQTLQRERSSSPAPALAETPGISYGHQRRTSISADVRRMSLSADKQQTDDLRCLLETFCLHCPDVSYVQGMSYLASVFLEYMPPPRAFVALVNLVDCDYFHSYLQMNVEEIRLRFKIFTVIFKHNMPRLYERFKAMDLLPDCYLMEWCMTLYSKQLPIHLCSRVWDGYFVHGEVFIFQAAVGLLSILESQLELLPVSECMRLLRSPPQNIPEDRLCEAIQSVHIPTRIQRYYAVKAEQDAAAAAQNAKQ